MRISGKLKRSAKKKAGIIKELDGVVTKMTELLGLNREPVVTIKDCVGGYAYVSGNRITIPFRILSRVKEFAVHYVVHEMCHFKVSDHPPAFKELERKMLKLWNISPDYTNPSGREGRYTTALYEVISGRKLCDGSGRRV